MKARLPQGMCYTPELAVFWCLDGFSRLEALLSVGVKRQLEPDALDPANVSVQSILNESQTRLKAAMKLQFSQVQSLCRRLLSCLGDAYTQE